MDDFMVHADVWPPYVQIDGCYLKTGLLFRGQW